MKKFIISVTLILLMASPLYGQSADEKRFTFRTAFVAHALTYNLDKQNVVGFHFGELSQDINENNIEKGVNSFIGFNYGYAFDCINCDSFFVGALLSNGNSDFTTDDGSTYTYSGWGLGVVGGYG